MKRKKVISYSIGGRMSSAKVRITIETDYQYGYGRDDSGRHTEALTSLIVREISDSASIPLTRFKFR